MNDPLDSIPRGVILAVYIAIGDLLDRAPGTALDLLTVALGLSDRFLDPSKLIQCGLVEMDGSLRKDIKNIARACIRTSRGEKPASVDEILDASWEIPPKFR
jgi:hypothetical protein